MAGVREPPRRQGKGGFIMKAVEIVVTKVFPKQAPTMEKVVLRDGRTTWVKSSVVNRLAKAGMVLHLA
jgi:hypothetical protein